ncbi:helix-turn-helix domain-containing protein [Riemerella anatipestifer]|uniref:Helix-turn-helix transcriptional regulator n=1 Tax=Riemerella anatipestifer TaxID=34085 RepID=A0AAP6LKF6_RIEAN|nr:helix-turn-helix transcriptional regulator [Riemerella anatipestifer]MBT0549332.1 helix-turn-helix transcriptional regulator [Riemerella anatipestifer]MBT0555893.1 helix-turn-helix transcriptional regulator [Riemerella anatipestifer]MBT0560095.1 helix-turn-helix transcriptional regulator [Riemerella anatipestifer]MCO7355053.1 helix-turn-helix transcriptional regulator [Riemerella anatipestifer]MCU7540743.1 helix-turn-helix transcriptional regulator [Riemerella anatipestifer]
MSLGKKLLEIRKAHGLSQEDLAVELEISQSTISNYEKEITHPDISVLEGYSKFFKIPVMDLLDSDTKIVYNYQNTGGENAFQIIKNTSEELIEQYKETIASLKEQIEVQRKQIELLEKMLKNR